MSDEYAHHAGRTADPNFAAQTLAEERAYAEGRAERYGATTTARGSGGGSGGIMLPLLVVWAVVFWPLGSALMLLPAYMTWRLFDGVAANAESLRPLLAALAAGGVGLFIGIRIERLLQCSAVYRGARHVARLVGSAAVATRVMLEYPGTPPIPSDWTLAWVNQQLSPFQWALIAAVVVATHVLSRRSDRELADAENAENAEDAYEIEDEDRGDRWRRRGRSLVFFGVAGGLLMPLLGLEADNIFPAFAFGGVLGALLSGWLYPPVVHPVWRLMPWVYFAARNRRPGQRRSSPRGA